MPGLGSILSLLRLGNVGPVPTDIYGNDPRYQYRTPPFVPENISAGPYIPPFGTTGDESPFAPRTARIPVAPIDVDPIIARGMLGNIFGGPVNVAAGEPQAPRPDFELPQPPVPETEAIDQMYDLLQRIPKREDYKPSWLRRIFAIPQEYMRPGAGEAFKELPYQRALTGWKAQFEPWSKAATEERLRDVNERQIWSAQQTAEIQRQRLMIDQQRADVAKWKIEHPNHTYKEDKDGFVRWINPITNESGLVIGSDGRPMQKLSEEARLMLGFEAQKERLEMSLDASMERAKYLGDAAMQRVIYTADAAMKRLKMQGANQRDLAELNHQLDLALEEKRTELELKEIVLRGEQQIRLKQTPGAGGATGAGAGAGGPGDIRNQRAWEQRAIYLRNARPDLERHIRVEGGVPRITGPSDNPAVRESIRKYVMDGVEFPGLTSPPSLLAQPTAAPTTPTKPTQAPPPGQGQQEDEVLIRNKRTGAERYMKKSNLGQLDKFPDWEVVRQ